MTTDGTYLYLTYEAGNSANVYDIAKYSISGTTFTYVDTITLSDAYSFNYYAVRANGEIIASGSSPVEIRRYSSSGTFIEGGSSLATATFIFNKSNSIYVAGSTEATYKILYL